MNGKMRDFVNWGNLPYKYTTDEMIKALPVGLL